MSDLQLNQPAAPTRTPRPPAPAIVRHTLKALDRLSPKLSGRLAHALYFAVKGRCRLGDSERQIMALAECSTIENGGLAVPVYTWGDARASHVVLLVHGWEGRAGQLAAFVPALTSQGFRVVSFDAPGHGAAPG